jgi:hypothetical protein
MNDTVDRSELERRALVAVALGQAQADELCAQLLALGDTPTPQDA